MALLTATRVSHYFGGLRAVSDFNLQLQAGELMGVIGPNGAGKTTVFNLITGVYRATEGSIRFRGAELVGKSPHEITALRIARTQIYPVVTTFLERLASAIREQEALGLETDRGVLQRVAQLNQQLARRCEALEEALRGAPHEVHGHLRHCADTLMPSMGQLRETVDGLEGLVETSLLHFKETNTLAGDPSIPALSVDPLCIQADLLLEVANAHAPAIDVLLELVPF